MSKLGVRAQVNNLGVRICTSKLLRLTVALAMSASPFQAPQVIHAQSSDTAPTPACEFQLNTLKPGQFCVPQILEFKTGDSNTTIEQHKRDEDLQRQRELAYSRTHLGAKPHFATVSASGMNKLYPYSGQCVPFARAYSGIQISGIAKNIPINSDQPEVGSIIITWESLLGHAAVVTAKNGPVIHVVEGNFLHGWASERDINVQASAGLIKGYVRPS